MLSSTPTVMTEALMSLSWRVYKHSKVRGGSLSVWAKRPSRLSRCLGFLTGPMIHPAARGKISRRELYHAHVAGVLKEQGHDQR